MTVPAPGGRKTASRTAHEYFSLDRNYVRRCAFAILGNRPFHLGLVLGLSRRAGSTIVL